MCLRDREKTVMLIRLVNSNLLLLLFQSAGRHLRLRRMESSLRRTHPTNTSATIVLQAAPGK